MGFDIDGLLTRYLTEGIAANKKNHVGLELEFPILRVRGGPIDMEVIRGLFPALAGIGFDRQSFAGELPLKALDGQGNAVTFDTCYAVLEYVTTSAPDMVRLYRRFYQALEAVQGYLRAHGHMLCGLGFNPTEGAPLAPKVPADLTLAIGQVLAHGYAGARAKYLDFYVRIASEQIHFNTTPQELPTLMRMLTYADLANMLLFSNSPARLGGLDYLCMRHRLYRSSRLNALGMTGAQPLWARSLEDYVREYRKICMFSRHRDGQRQVFQPVPFEDYFSDPAYEAREEDIWDFDIERNVVTTRYGTVEYRTLCAQSFGEAFMPSAFTLGLRERLDDALALCQNFYQAHGMQDANQLLDRAALSGDVAGVDEAELEGWLRALLELSLEGLKSRGWGEEAFLAPLLARSRMLDCPARRFVRTARREGLPQALEQRAEVSPALL